MLTAGPAQMVRYPQDRSRTSGAPRNVVRTLLAGRRGLLAGLDQRDAPLAPLAPIRHGSCGVDKAKHISGRSRALSPPFRGAVA